MKTTNFLKILALVALATILIFNACKRDKGLTLSEESISVGQNGDTVQIKVTTSDRWVAVSDTMWARAVPSSATGNATVNIIVDPNAYYEDRTNRINFRVDGHIKKTLTIEQVSLVAARSISLNKTSLTLYEGDSTTLTATVSPENAQDKSIIWSSSNANAVSVDSAGKVTAMINPGSLSAVITATSAQSGVTATCNVNVIFHDITESVIPMSNIRFAYPVPNQKYFFIEEGRFVEGGTDAYIYLKADQGYLFQNNVVKARFISNIETLTATPTYNTTDNKITIGLPDIDLNTNYTFELYTEGASETVLLSYPFKTSRYWSLAEKIDQIVMGYALLLPYILNNTMQIQADMTRDEHFEFFDSVEALGNRYTGNKPLIVLFSTMDDDFFLNQIAPYIYNDYPFDGYVNFARSEGQSLLPYWGIAGIAPTRTREINGELPWRYRLHIV
ncbi:hypothetical protein FACS1894201_08840 [Bacteroidia bacterium]|nr:hypothetical protein FACS1894201_08840 [Bacteroidia bacterium]